MDPTSAIRTDAIPTVATLVLPGAVATSPVVALLWGPPHNLGLFIDKHEGASLLAAALVAIGAGFLLESIGSYVEYYILDSRHSDRGRMKQVWWRYLRTTWSTEPIGQHYLRRILLVFKFELNLLVSSFGFALGLVALWWFGIVSQGQFIGIGAATVGLIAYLCHAATQSSLLLGELREQLLFVSGNPAATEDDAQMSNRKDSAT